MSELHDDIWEDPFEPDEFVYDVFETNPILSEDIYAHFDGTEAGAKIADLFLIGLSEGQTEVGSDFSIKMATIIHAVAWSVLFQLEKELKWTEDQLQVARTVLEKPGGPYAEEDDQAEAQA